MINRSNPSKLGKYTPEEFARVIKDKSFIQYLSDLACKEGAKEVLENYPYHDVTLEQFHYLARKSGTTLHHMGYKLQPYNLNRSRDPLDHWVAESLKEFDRPLYDSCKGYTKIARPTRAYHGLLRFTLPLISSKEIKSDPFFASCYKKALGDLDLLFKDEKFSTLTFPEFMKQIPQNTAAGYPFIGKKKGDVWSEVHRRSMDNYVRLCNGERIQELPCTLALRGHLSPINENKTRSIWVVPFETIVLENVLFRGMYDYIFRDKDASDLILTGKDTLGRLRDYLCLNEGLHFVNLDYSAWDSWRCRFLAIDTFDVLKKHLDLKDGEENVFYYVRKQFINSLLLMPDGTVYRKQAGTPTGSLLTALINSLMNFVALRTSFYILGVPSWIERLKILGDDASFYYGGSEEAGNFIKRLSHLLLRLFGLRIKPEKCLIVLPDEPIEKKRFIGYNLVGSQLYKPEEDFFLSVLYPEHDVKNVVVSFSRVFSYYLLGGIFHDYFNRWFKQYLGHYWHLLSKEERILNEEVFKAGNLRVIKHVFQVEVDQFLVNFDVNKFSKIDFLKIPYFLTLRIPLKSLVVD